jgi:hypothetical protein
LGAETVAAYRRPWLALATGPAATATTPLVNFVMASQACSGTGRTAMIALVLLALAATASAGWHAWRNSRDDEALHAERETGESVVAFMWQMTALSNLFFVLVILAFSVPPLLLHDCH